MNIRPRPRRRFIANYREVSSWAFAGLTALKLWGCNPENAPEPCATCQGAQQNSGVGGTPETSSSSTGGKRTHDSGVPGSSGKSASSSPPIDASMGGMSAIASSAAGASNGGSVASSAADFAWPERCTKVVGSVAKGMVAAGALLLDVRNPDEFAVDSLPGAVNMPLPDLATRKAELNVARPVVVYCHSGSRAAQALTELCAAGFGVYNLGPEANWSL